MNTSKALFGAALALALGSAAACNPNKVTVPDGKGGTVTVDTNNAAGTVTAESSDGTFTINGEGTVPTGLPANVKPYPGANVVASMMTSGENIPGGGGGGGMLAMETSDAPDKVIAFYKPQFDAMSEKMTNTTEDATMLGGKGADGITMTVIVNAPDGPGDKTGISVTWTKGPDQ
jgi:hypothetical protein